MNRPKGRIILQVEVFVEPDGDGYHAFCPAFKGLHMDGETEEEALRNTIEALGAYIRSLIKHGEPIPSAVILGEKEIKRHRGLSSFKEQIPLSACV